MKVIAKRERQLYHLELGGKKSMALVGGAAEGTKRRKNENGLENIFLPSSPPPLLFLDNCLAFFYGVNLVKVLRSHEFSLLPNNPMRATVAPCHFSNLFYLSLIFLLIPFLFLFFFLFSFFFFLFSFWYVCVLRVNETYVIYNSSTLPPNLFYFFLPFFFSSFPLFILVPCTLRLLQSHFFLPIVAVGARSGGTEGDGGKGSKEKS
jgi:hypothetical protein